MINLNYIEPSGHNHKMNLLSQMTVRINYFQNMNFKHGITQRDPIT